MSDDLFILVPNLSIQHANALTCPYFLTPAVPMACRQFARALARDLGAEGHDTGVAIVHHHVEMLGEWVNYRFIPHQRRGSTLINQTDLAGSNKSPGAMALQPVATMHLKLSLILRFRDIGINERQVSRAIAGRKLAGGSIVDHDEIRVMDSSAKAFDAIKTGYIVIERTDLMEPKDGQNRVQAWCQALFHEKVEGHPWLVPALLGFGLLSEPKKRLGAREGYPVAFAEPLAGIVEYLPRRKFDDGPVPFWDYVIEDDFVAVSSIHHQGASTL